MDARVQTAPRDLIGSLAKTPPLVAVTSPVIYSLLVPFALLDFWVSIYQAICFPVYHIERVRRSAHFQLDRGKLPYLNTLEKLNCFYCSYVNGVVAYVREVAARTEQYWCPIKHADEPVDAHERYDAFVEYGQGVGYRDRRDELRAALRAEAGALSKRTVTPAVRPSHWR